jgi:hypothetical protein
MMKITIYYARSCLNSTKVFDMVSLSRIYWRPPEGPNTSHREFYHKEDVDEPADGETSASLGKAPMPLSR